jgi:hypothetical protein
LQTLQKKYIGKSVLLKSPGGSGSVPTVGVVRYIGPKPTKLLIRKRNADMRKFDNESVDHVFQALFNRLSYKKGVFVGIDRLVLNENH